jgi:hypothetical protein
MYGQGNYPPPYQHQSQLPAPNQMGPQGPNPPYPALKSHSYSVPHSTPLPQLPPPPPRLPFLPQQQLYQSLTTAPTNFIPAPPPPQFGPLSSNLTTTISLAIPALPTSTLPPPPPSLPPPCMPPPPPEVSPKPSREVVPDRDSLDSSSCTNLE